MAYLLTVRLRFRATQVSSCLTRMWSICGLIATLAWLSYTAATVNSTVRNQFIDMIWKRASYNGSAGVFPATYDVDSGTVTGGAARCVANTGRAMQSG